MTRGIPGRVRLFSSAPAAVMAARFGRASAGLRIPTHPVTCSGDIRSPREDAVRHRLKISPQLGLVKLRIFRSRAQRQARPIALARRRAAVNWVSIMSVAFAWMRHRGAVCGLPRGLAAPCATRDWRGVAMWDDRPRRLTTGGKKNTTSGGSTPLLRACRHKGSWAADFFE
jgi:hypothetical protein